MSNQRHRVVAQQTEGLGQKNQSRSSNYRQKYRLKGNSLFRCKAIKVSPWLTFWWMPLKTSWHLRVWNFVTPMTTNTIATKKLASATKVPLYHNHIQMRSNGKLLKSKRGSNTCRSHLQAVEPRETASWIVWSTTLSTTWPSRATRLPSTKFTQSSLQTLRPTLHTTKLQAWMQLIVRQATLTFWSVETTQIWWSSLCRSLLQTLQRVTSPQRLLWR